jgi:hypothetical protein
MNGSVLKDRRRAWPPRAALHLFLGAFVAVLFAGCMEPSSQTYTYRFEITVSGSTGSDLTTTLRNETEDTLLATESGTGTPRSYLVTGEIDHSSPQVVSVSADVTDLPAGESFSVKGIYVDESYEEPLSVTLVDATRTNGTAGANDYSITEHVVLPYAPQ